jgi:hypothetical protein
MRRNDEEIYYLRYNFNAEMWSDAHIFKSHVIIQLNSSGVYKSVVYYTNTNHLQMKLKDDVV